LATRIFDFIELSYDKLTQQVNTWLKTLYHKSNITFSEASPYGQILKVIKELFTHTILYNKNSVAQIDIRTSNNEKVIKNIARIAGHDPSRGISASGSINFKLKNGVNIFDEIKGGVITVKDKTLLKNRTNNLYYTIVLGKDYIDYTILQNSNYIFNIVQGRFEKQSFTGDGSKNQSVSVNIPNSQNIDNFNFNVYYNGIILDRKEHMYDMLDREYAFYSRTGFMGGLDIYFGNGEYGFIPSLGSLIEIEYLITDGVNGNILNNKINDFKIMDDIVDEKNNVINIDNLFNIYIYNDINMGSNPESIIYTKSIIPHVSRNFVLGTPQQFVYHLRKLNMFSKINAYNRLDSYMVNNDRYIDYFIEETFKDISNNINFSDVKKKMKTYFPNVYDNQIYLYLIPDIKKYFIDNYNYFNIPFDVFYLDDDEKDKIINYIKSMGTLSITTNINIINPIISLYCANVFVRRYKNSTEDDIRNEIINIFSDYFINNERFDRVIKADLIKTIKNSVNDVDSVNIDFICKKNEDFHRKNKENVSKLKYIREVRNQVDNTSNTLNIQEQFNSNVILGIDPIQGDIIVEKDEVPILRGGFFDRNGIYYSDDINSEGMCTINIIFTEK
jgi:hypothetical protein